MLFLTGFNKTETFSTGFRNKLNIKFNGNPSAGTELFHWTDLTKLILAFDNSVNASKDSCWYGKLTELTIEICFHLSETIRCSCAARTTGLKSWLCMRCPPRAYYVLGSVPHIKHYNPAIPWFLTVFTVTKCSSGAASFTFLIKQMYSILRGRYTETNVPGFSP